MAAAAEGNVIEIQFGNLTGSVAASFGASVLAMITFTNEPFDGLSDGGVYDASITISNVVSAIPLPASLPLLLAGLGGIGWLRSRRPGDLIS